MTPSSLETVRDAFTSICQQFQKFVEQGDGEGIASLYLEDAQFNSPKFKPIELSGNIIFVDIIFI